VNKKAEAFPRILAYLIDLLIAWLPVFIPVIGALFGSLYLLFKDALMYRITGREEWKNRSIGKKLLDLEVVNLDGEIVDLTVSAKRNLPLTIGNFIAVVPFVGWVIGPATAFVLTVVELIMVLSNEDGRRLGDLWADTKVVKVVEVELEEDIVPK